MMERIWGRGGGVGGGGKPEEEEDAAESETLEAITRGCGEGGHRHRSGGRRFGWPPALRERGTRSGRGGPGRAVGVIIIVLVLKIDKR